MERRHSHVPARVEGLESRTVLSARIGPRQAVLQLLRGRAESRGPGVEARQDATPTSRVVRIAGHLATSGTGAFPAILRVYNTAEGGTPLFEERQILPLRDGAFRAALGTTVAGGLPKNLAQDNSSLYVGVFSARRPNRQLRARLPLTAATFAIGGDGEQGPPGPQGPQGGAPVSVGGGMAGISIGRNGRPIHALSALITGLAAGTYSVGMAGSSTATDWNSLGRGYTTVLVIRP